MWAGQRDVPSSVPCCPYHGGAHERTASVASHLPFLPESPTPSGTSPLLVAARPLRRKSVLHTCARTKDGRHPVRTSNLRVDTRAHGWVTVRLQYHSLRARWSRAPCATARASVQSVPERRDSPDREGRPKGEFAARAATPAHQGQVVMLLFLLSPFCTRPDLSSGCRPTVVAPRAWLVSLQRQTCWCVCVQHTPQGAQRTR